MDVVVNMAPISATRVRVMFVSLEEIRSDLSLLSRHAQQFLLACAQPSGSKGTGRYTPQSRAVLQCDEADRRVNNRTIAVMERRGAARIRGGAAGAQYEWGCRQVRGGADSPLANGSRSRSCSGCESVATCEVNLGVNETLITRQVRAAAAGAPQESCRGRRDRSAAVRPIRA